VQLRMDNPENLSFCLRRRDMCFSVYTKQEYMIFWLSKCHWDMSQDTGRRQTKQKTQHK
jgi:hypothetical protein